MNTVLNITPRQLQAIILSHGWFSLKPFAADVNPPCLKVPYSLPRGEGLFEILAEDGCCKLRVVSGKGKHCLDVAERCLSLDIAPEILYANRAKKWNWLSSNRMGRFLRSPSLFEDCCKVICSTNTTFDRTESMVARLVDEFGVQVGKYRAFPEPDALLKAGEAALRAETGCGFRAKYILGIAERALSEQGLFLDKGWQVLDNKSFYDMLIANKGIGPASANYLCLVYWKPKGFNIDSYVVRRCCELWGLVAEDIPSFLARRYEVFGTYAPIVFWFDITKHWHRSDLDMSAMSW
jgi:3-methyladenine DNA glycosylase/8-oxoguanine DNA glycosylase